MDDKVTVTRIPLDQARQCTFLQSAGPYTIECWERGRNVVKHEKFVASSVCDGHLAAECLSVFTHAAIRGMAGE